jgi:NAD-dependent SIR2 family protein deacetylase
MSYSKDDVLLFIGAGASAAFGIPTMKRFVGEFEEFISSNEEHLPSQVHLYKKIKEVLTQQLKRDVDLEDVFTVINALASASSNQPTKDPYSLYLFSKYIAEATEQIEKDMNSSLGLLANFQRFCEK